MDDPPMTTRVQEFVKILLKTQDNVLSSIRVYNSLYIKIITRTGKRSLGEANRELSGLYNSLNIYHGVLEKIEPKIDELPPSSVQRCLAILCCTALATVMGYIHNGIPALQKQVNIALGQVPSEDARLDMKLYLEDLTPLPDSPEVDYSRVYLCKKS